MTTSPSPPTDVSEVTARPPDRFETLGYKSPRKKPEGGPKELTAKHRLLIEYQLFGCPHDFVRKITRPAHQVDKDTGEVVTIQKPVEPGEPLTLIEAADLLRIRRRNARQLAGYPIFRTAFAAELQRLREGEKARSVHTMIGIRDDLGDGKAADRKVRLEASKAVLGEGEGNRGTTVNVTNQVGVQVRAGLVLRIPADAPRIPLEDEDGVTVTRTRSE